MENRVDTEMGSEFNRWSAVPVGSRQY